MKSTSAEIGRILAALEQTPLILGRIAAECSERRLGSALEEGEWSAQEVMAHLRARADLWTQSIYAMLAEKDPALADINERKYARAARYGEVPFKPALTEFRSQRANLLRVLKSLKPGEWERGAVILGRRHTVFTQARRLAKHEGEHAGQFDALLK